MSKNKKPTKLPDLTKPANTKRLNVQDSNPNTNNAQSNKGWGGVYDKNMSNNIITKLSDNIKHNFEQNIELGQDALKCKTAADFIEFQRKHFETNYKNTVKLLNDLFYDIQNITTKNINTMAKYPEKG